MYVIVLKTENGARTYGLFKTEEGACRWGMKNLPNESMFWVTLMTEVKSVHKVVIEISVDGLSDNDVSYILAAQSNRFFVGEGWLPEKIVYRGKEVGEVRLEEKSNG